MAIMRVILALARVMLHASSEPVVRIAMELGESKPKAITVRRIIRVKVTTSAKPLFDRTGEGGMGLCCFIGFMNLIRGRCGCGGCC